MCRRPPVPLVRGVGGFVTAVKGGDTEVVSLPLPALDGIVRRRATEPTALGAGRRRRRCSGCLADEVPAFAPAVAARGVPGGQGTVGLSISALSGRPEHFRLVGPAGRQNPTGEKCPLLALWFQVG